MIFASVLGAFARNVTLDSYLLKYAYELYKTYSHLLWLPFTLAMLARLSYSNITLSGSQSHFAVLKDIIKYAVWIYGFPLFVGTLLTYTSDLANSISQIPFTNVEPASEEFFNFGGLKGLVVALVMGFVHAISSLILLLRCLLLAVTLGLSPIILFFGFVFGLSELVQKMVILILMASIWPILFALLTRMSADVIVAGVGGASNGMAEIALNSVAQVGMGLAYAMLQLSIPLATIALAAGTSFSGLNPKNAARNGWDKMIGIAEMAGYEPKRSSKNSQINQNQSGHSRNPISSPNQSSPEINSSDSVFVGNAPTDSQSYTTPSNGSYSTAIGQNSRSDKIASHPSTTKNQPPNITSKTIAESVT